MNGNQVNVLLFIEGSFMPSYDGYSLVMSNVCQLLQSMQQIRLTVVHCYRGWSDIAMLQASGIHILLVDPETYYEKPENIIELLGDQDFDIIQMQDPELIVGMGAALRAHYKSKLIFHPHYSSGKIAGTSDMTETHKQRTREYEFAALWAADVVLCLTNEDGRYLVDTYGMSPSIVTVYAAPAFAIDNHIVGAIPPKSRPQHTRNIFYLGSLYHPPNVDAVERLLTMMPDLGTYVDGLYIIGDKPKALFEKANDPKIHFLGTVEDLDPLLSTMNLGIFPIDEGSGVRTKIVYCFQAGVPVIGSTKAFQGLAGCESLIADTENGLLEKTKRILDDYELQADISQWESAYMAHHFSIDLIRKQLTAIYSNKGFIFQDKAVNTLPHKDPIWLERYKKMQKDDDTTVTDVALPLIL